MCHYYNFFFLTRTQSFVGFSGRRQLEREGFLFVSSHQYITLLSLSLSISIHIPTYTSVCLSFEQFIYLCIKLTVSIQLCLSTYLLTNLSIYQYIKLFINLSIHLPLYLFSFKYQVIFVLHIHFFPVFLFIFLFCPSSFTGMFLFFLHFFNSQSFYSGFLLTFWHCSSL